MKPSVSEFVSSARSSGKRKKLKESVPDRSVFVCARFSARRRTLKLLQPRYRRVW